MTAISPIEVDMATPPPDIAAKLDILRQQAAERAKQDAQYSRQTDRQYTPVIQPNPNWMPKKADGGVVDAINRGMDTMFPARKLARIAVLANTQAPLERMRNSVNPAYYDYVMDQTTKNPVSMPLPKPEDMTPIKGNGLAKGGTMNQDAMRLALMNKGGQYPYADAHEKARLNAIKMLGLHEHNTAADRAKAMGFDLETFHGTDHPDIESLDPERTKVVKGVFSTTHPRTASRYAEDNKKRAGEKSAPNIIPLLLKSASHKGMSRFDINTINSHRERGDKGVYRPEMQTAVTFDPSHMRSRFAAFDPAREHETHLLAANGGSVTHAHHLEIEERPL